MVRSLLSVIVVSLSVKASAGRHSAKYALTHFDVSQSGWTPGWAFFVGMLPVRPIHSLVAEYSFELLLLL